MARYTIPEEELMTSGHFGCLGCGATMAMRYVLKALGDRTVITVPACCWAVMPGVFPYTCMKIPMLYTAFETTGASASGIRAGLDSQGKQDITVVGFAGDGGTADIGIQALSGMIERGHNVIYICYDNEAYMNTGMQRSSMTPYGTWTTTTPVGPEKEWEKGAKKNMMDIVVAHKIPYAATANTSFPEDLVKKVKKALTIQGPKYIHIYAPCPTGWKQDPGNTVRVGKLAVDCGVAPLFEVENGVYKVTRKPKELKPLVDYMKIQGRFKHLPPEEVEGIEKEIHASWKHLLDLEEFSQTRGFTCYTP